VLGEVRERVHGQDSANVGVAFSAAGVKPAVLEVMKELVAVPSTTSFATVYSDAALFGVYGNTTTPDATVHAFISAIKGVASKVRESTSQYSARLD
jgi:hypothetical protein